MLLLMTLSFTKLSLNLFRTILFQLTIERRLEGRSEEEPTFGGSDVRSEEPTFEGSDGQTDDSVKVIAMAPTENTLWASGL